VTNEQKYAEKARELERRVSMLRKQRRLAEERRQKEREGQSNAVAAGVSIKQPEIPSKGSKKPANEGVTTFLEGLTKVLNLIVLLQRINLSFRQIQRTRDRRGPTPSAQTRGLS
jgi:hypothetical protein